RLVAAGLASVDARRRYRLDVGGRPGPTARHQSRARLLRCRAEHQPQDEPQWHRDGALEHDLHQRRADAVWRAVVGRPHARTARGTAGLAGTPVATGEWTGGASQLAVHRARVAVPVDRAQLGGPAGRAYLGADLRLTALGGAPPPARGVRLAPPRPSR